MQSALQKIARKGICGGMNIYVQTLVSAPYAASCIGGHCRTGVCKWGCVRKAAYKLVHASLCVIKIVYDMYELSFVRAHASRAPSL